MYQLLASLRALLTGAGKLEEELAHVVQHVLSILGVVAGLPWIAHINVSKQNMCYFFGEKSVADPGSRMGKKSGSGSGMNNPDHISESLKNSFLG